MHLLRDGSIVEAHFDRVFDQDVSQEETYRTVKDAVQAVTNGYNSTVFAYGQTGTGKTYTILGAAYTGKEAVGAAPDEASDGGDKAKAMLPAFSGIIPRAANDLFHFAEQAALRAEKVDVFCTYLEIYNERMHDLLAPFKKHKKRDPLDVTRKKTELELRDDPERGIYVPGSTVVKVTSAQSLMKILRKGNKHRTVRQTEMNQKSSRSHTILQLSIEQRVNRGDQAVLIRSKLNLVDLAGSERFPQMESTNEERIKEQTTINGSLSALANVISCITEKGRTHIPYRDSKLTHLLQDSLGGNCLTTILATISPSECAVDESMSTLKFATRARNILNIATTNIVKDPQREIEAKDKEIGRLRDLLSKFVGGGEGDGTSNANTGNPVKVLTTLQDNLKDASLELEGLRVECRNLREELKSEKLQKKQLMAILRSKNDQRYEYLADGSLSLKESLKATTSQQNGGGDGFTPQTAGRVSGKRAKRAGGGAAGPKQSSKMTKFQKEMHAQLEYRNGLHSTRSSAKASMRKKPGLPANGTPRSVPPQDLASTSGEEWSKVQQEVDDLRSNLGIKSDSPDYESQPVSPRKAWGRSSLFSEGRTPMDRDMPQGTRQEAWTHSMNGGDASSPEPQHSLDFRASSIGPMLDLPTPMRSQAPIVSKRVENNNFDKGSLIYILGKSSSSLWAKKIMADIDKGNRRLKNIEARARNGHGRSSLTAM